MASFVKPFVYRHWQDWADVLLGIIVLISPWILNFTHAPAPTYNAVIVGLAIIALSVLALRHLEPWEEWLNIGLGLWLIISPWVLAYGTASSARASHVGLGLLITLLAASELWEEGQDGERARHSGEPRGSGH